MFLLGSFKAVQGDQSPLVAKSTQNIRSLTTKIVEAAKHHDQQTSLLALAKSAISAAAAEATPATSGKLPIPPPARKQHQHAGKTTPAAKLAEGLEETKVNGGGEGGGGGGNSKSSKKKTSKGNNAR